MPVIAATHLHARNTGTSATFSAVFAAIGFVVVASCIGWAYLWPRWQNRHPRPSSTRFNCIGGAAKYSTPPRYAPRFPAHPAVRGLRKCPSQGVPLYNPRTETPFPNSPQTGESVSLADLSSRASTEHSRTSRWNKGGSDYALPIPPPIPRLLRSGHIFSSLDGEILEIPPSVARPAGRAPSLSRQLTRFPMPSSTTKKRFDTLAHPNLLFEKIDKLNVEHDSLRPNGSPNKVQMSNRPAAAANSKENAPVTLPAKRYGDSRKNTITKAAKDIHSEVGDISEIDNAMSDDSGIGFLQDAHEDIWKKTYLQPPEPVQTVRARMPVADIRHRYDRALNWAKPVPPRKISLSKHLTSSLDPLVNSASTSSDRPDLTTPPTSPPPPTNTPVLLPTPLQLRRAAVRSSAISPTPGQDHSATNSLLKSTTLKSVDEKLTASTRDLKDNAGVQSIKINVTRSKTTSKVGTRPRPIHINTARANSLHRAIFEFRAAEPASATGTLSTARPPTALRTVWKASSVYSRDTSGRSILRSPVVTPRLGEHVEREVPLSHPSPKRATSMEMLRSKIDEWNLHTGYLDGPRTSTTSDQRPLSYAGLPNPDSHHNYSHGHPDSPLPLSIRRNLTSKIVETSLNVPPPVICMGRPSDDVFRDTDGGNGCGRVLKRVLDMEMANSTDTIDLAMYSGRTAPGGAEWI